MILKVNDMIKKYDTICKLIDNEKITDVSLKYKLLTLLHYLESHKNNVDKLRDELVKKYGTVDEHGDYTLKETDESFKDYLSDINKLLEQEIQIMDVPKIKFIEVVNIIPNEDLLALYEFITDGD